MLTHRYLGGVSVLEAKQEQSSSPFWKGLLKARDVLWEGFSFNLGNDISSLWFDDKSGYGALGKHIPFIHISDLALTLPDIIIDGQWNVTRLCTAIPYAFLQRLQNINLVAKPTIEDHWIWCFSRHGMYKTYDPYACLSIAGMQAQTPAIDSWAWIWKLMVSEKLRVFIWLVSDEALQVNFHRFRCRLASSLGCSRCTHPIEDGLHCLRDCPFSREVWSRLGALSWPRFTSANVKAWVRSQAQGQHVSLFVAVIWGVWHW